MAYHNELGKWGEDVAVSYLQQLGYVILHRDWDYHHRDLDIVAIDNGTLVIVEVKTRKNEQFADADEAYVYELFELQMLDKVREAIEGSDPDEFKEIKVLQALPLEELLEQRYQRFRKY